MKNLRNSVKLIGHLGKDPVVSQTKNGKDMARFSLATSEKYKDGNGELVDKTQWHNIVAWGRTAGIAKQYLTKGKEIALEGTLEHRSYEDKEGNTRYITEVVVNELLMLGRPNT